MTRPVPAHGTNARAIGTNSGSRPPCRCPECKQALYRRRKENRLGARRYASPEQIATAAAHIAYLREQQAMSLNKVCVESNVSLPTLRRVIRGRRVQIAIVARVLTVHGRTVRFGGDYIPAVGYQRKVRALFALGHTYRAMARKTGLTWQGVRLIALGGQPTIRVASAERIDRLYRSWSMLVGPSQRNRGFARSYGWAKPLHWREDTIDDPDGFPDWTGHCGTASGWLLHRAEGEEPCVACAAVSPEAEAGGSPTLWVQRCREAVEVLRGDGCTWERIGNLVQVSGKEMSKALDRINSARLGVAA